MNSPPDHPLAPSPRTNLLSGGDLAETLAPRPVPPTAATEATPPTAGLSDTLAAAAVSAAPAPVAYSVSGYEVLGELGRGGMGVVYKARQLSLNRIVALKMVLSGGHASPAERARFKAEAEAVAKLQHPNIVSVYEVGEHQGHPYLALEFCPGGSLDRKLGGVPLAPEEAARLAECLARAMHLAHTRGVVHRDLKPANILLAESDIPKVTDFGLAKMLDSGSGQTQTGAVLGTPSYMAPEQARGKSKGVGPAADTYALGAILYELLTGRPPFRGESSMDTLALVLNEEPVRPRRLRPTVPRDLETVCLKCLHKEPEDRYASALELAEDLRRFVEGGPVLAGRGSWLGGARRLLGRQRRVGALAGMALAAVVALVVSLGGRGPPAAEQDPYAELRRQEVEREVASRRRGRPARFATHPAATVEVKRIPTPDNSAFEVLDDARVWDLRGWRPVPPEGKGELVSAASMECRLRLRKLRSAKEYAQQARTSGADVFIRCVSHPNAARVLVQRDPSHVGLEQTKTRECLVDVSNVPLQEEFGLRFVSTFWNSLQTDADRWVGVMGYRQAFKVSMLVLFPEDRPFRDYWLTVAPTVHAAPTPFAGRKIILDADKSFLYWEILEPAEGQVYRLHWAW